MSAASTTSTSNELTTVADIRVRYDLPGPHVTAILEVPTPGTVGDDLGIRWSATEADLIHLGASRVALGHMADLLRSTQRRGHPLLLTANDHDAAGCWLGCEVESSLRIGPLPALVPALHRVAFATTATIGAAIDRSGADLFRIGAFDITSIATVHGDDEHIHKAASGGWSQARHQRHSEVIWERNAALIATAIADEAERSAATGIVLTGDDREARLVEERLGDIRSGPIQRVRAGGRHEPGTPGRVRDAALEFREDRHRERTARALAVLREELGQQDQAVDGSVAVLEAIAASRVKSLFVDLAVDGRLSHLDETVRAALAQGADLVIGHDFEVSDGVAAILRMAYS